MQQQNNYSSMKLITGSVEKMNGKKYNNTIATE